MKIPKIKLSIAGNAKDEVYCRKIKRHIIENKLENKKSKRVGMVFNLLFDLGSGSASVSESGRI